MLGPLSRMTAVSRPRVVGPITVGHGVNEFFSIVVPPIIPLLVSDLGITYGQGGFLLTVFFVMYSLFQLPAGVVADRVGKRRIMLVGLVGMSAGVFLSSTADAYGTLVVGQAVAGIGGSTFHPTGMSIISDVETGTTEGKAMGVFGFGGALGTLAAPLLVGGLAAVAGWEVALGGGALLGLAVTLAVVPVLSDASDDDPAARTDGSRPASLRGVARLAGTLLSVPLTRGTVLLFAMTLVLSLQHRAIQTFTTSYVAAEAGASVSFGNLAFFALLLGGSVSSLWAGDLADRVDRARLGVGTAVATAVLVGATLFVPRVLGGVAAELVLVVFAVWFAVIGVTTYACYPVKNALISEQADAAFSGSLFGVMQTASALGSASGPALFGALADRWGVAAAFPAIAGVSAVLAVLFVLLARSD
jgi:MFS family permease